MGGQVYGLREPDVREREREPLEISTGDVAAAAVARESRDGGGGVGL